MLHPHAFLCHTPPFVPVAKSISGPQWHEKHPKFGSFKPAPKTALPETSNSRQSRLLLEA